MKNKEALDKQISKGERQALQGFQKVANTPPSPDNIKENPMANKAKYLPISFVEMKLDELFFGLWQTENFSSQVVVNEVIGSIELSVFHPVAKTWLKRTGAASTPIQLKKENGVSAKPTEVEKKIHNTLVKDYPHLKAECVKNAARSLGKAFGRDLNRVFEDKYTPLVIMPGDEEASYGQVSLIESLLSNANVTESERAIISKEMHGYTFNNASRAIAYLQENQRIEGLETLPGSQAEIMKATEKRSQRDDN